MFGRVLWGLAGMAIATSLYIALDAPQLQRSPYELPPQRWTLNRQIEVERGRPGGFFRPSTGDYYRCEPAPLGSLPDGTIMADYVNPVWFVYRANYDKVVTDRTCWRPE